MKEAENPLTILIITPLYPPAVGGAATYFGDIVPALAQRPQIGGLVILTERMPGYQKHQQEENVLILRSLPNRLSLKHHPWLIHAATYLLTQLWFTLFLPTLARRHHIDLIHFHTRYGGRLFHRALKRTNLPVLADLRDKLTDPKELGAVAHRIICCGEGIRQFCLDSGLPAAKVDMIPNSFNPPHAPTDFELSDAREKYDLPDTPFILYLGDITVNKGVLELLEAFSEWHPHHPEAKLLMAGVNREGKRFLQKLNATSGARFLGQLPHRDAVCLMEAAEIVILPSRSEGLPTVILEAISMGTKVVCPPDIPEFDQHLNSSVLTEVSAAEIVRLLEKTWLSSSIPSYPLEDHSVENVVNGLVTVYPKLFPQS